MKQHSCTPDYLGVVSLILLALSPVVKGNWGQWGPWGQCSVTCAGGDQSRSRTCLDSRFCSGTETDSRNCANIPCPINGGWENWESWTSCTKTCGGGTTSRARSCDAPSPAFGGRFCEGGVAENIDNESVEWQWMACNTFRCEGFNQPLQPVVLPTLPDTRTTASPSGGRPAPAPSPPASTASPIAPLPPAVNTVVPIRPVITAAVPSPSGPVGIPPGPTTGPLVNGWHPWGEWGPCSVTCAGGDHSRIRVCGDRNFCTGTEIVSQNCNNIPCPINGGWENWESWTSCTKTCGGGTTSRARSCDAPSPAFGGRFCEGGVPENIDNQSVEWEWKECNFFRCEGDNAPPTSVVLPTLPPTRTTASPTASRASSGGVSMASGPTAVPAIPAGTIASSGQLSGPVPFGPSGMFGTSGLLGSGPVGNPNAPARTTTSLFPPSGLFGTSGLLGSGPVATSGRTTGGSVGSSGGIAGRVAGSTSRGSGGTAGTPVLGGWNVWESWSSCLVSCGGGTASRVRRCNAPAPAFGGGFCEGGLAQNIDNQGAEWQWRICNRFRCPGVPPNVPLQRITRPTLPPSMTTVFGSSPGQHSGNLPQPSPANQPVPAPSQFRQPPSVTAAPSQILPFPPQPVTRRRQPSPPQPVTRRRQPSPARPVARRPQPPQPSPPRQNPSPQRAPPSPRANPRFVATPSPIYRPSSTAWDPFSRFRTMSRRPVSWLPDVEFPIFSGSSSFSNEGNRWPNNWWF